MTIEFVADGEKEILEIVRAEWNSAGNIKVKLFTAESASVHDSPAISDFTIASWTGYADVTVDDWSAPTHPDDTDHALTSPGSSVVFSNSSGSSQNCKGIVIIKDAATDILIGWGFLNSGSDVSISDGADLDVGITIKLKTTNTN